MIRVHVLHDKNYSRNGEAFLFPLHYNRLRLKNHNIAVSFYTTLQASVLECDVLCVSSRFFRSWWSEGDGQELLEWLGKASDTAGRVFWFDLSDSTGTTQFKVLPFVDGYIKNQVLKDRSFYQKHFYGMRIFTDFYHRHFHVEDSVPGEAHLNWIPETKQLKKIHVGWNYGMANHSPSGFRLGRIWYGRYFLPNWYPVRWSTPTLGRSVACSCRIGTSYERATVAFPRNRIVELVKERIDVSRVSKSQYFRELKDSLAAISPFGFGEICYRDFEMIICGAAMVKQDMSHLETWPDLWIKDLTYWPLSWDFSDFNERLQYVFSKPSKMVGMAAHAQQRYRRLLETDEGHEEFCEHFKDIINSLDGKL